MSTTLQLLDTPKKLTLQSQSTQIRAILKDFERTFAANNDGRKPSKDDIKADAEVAVKYKEYNKIRDVLSGKLDYSALTAVPKSPPRKQKHHRNDSGISCTPKRRDDNATPHKLLHPNDLDAYDVAGYTSPKPMLLHAIGPTPQRDGRVLGLFDLLSNSAHSSQQTPSGRKRKLEALVEDSPQKGRAGPVAQTPSRKKSNNHGDILYHLTGTPGDTPETGHRKLSRTPVSEGRKFMLSQFFATPNAARFCSIGAPTSKKQTPLRDRVLGMTPEDKLLQPQSLPQALDATPAYLRRSTSFKDRLLSASQTASGKVDWITPPTPKAGPPTLRHFRSIKLYSDFESKFADIEEEIEIEDYEDDLDALREMEDNEVNVLVEDSQLQSTSQLDDGQNDPVKGLQPPQKVWKKKGQKRTTRRNVMKPTRTRSKDAPKFVAAGDNSEDEDNDSAVEETQLNDESARPGEIRNDHMLDDEEYLSAPSGIPDAEDSSAKRLKSTSKTVTKSTAGKSKKTGTINPNAVSHMNFRSLKIKNKNSKAKGKGRFGRGRR